MFKAMLENAVRFVGPILECFTYPKATASVRSPPTMSPAHLPRSALENRFFLSLPGAQWVASSGHSKSHTSPTSLQSGVTLKVIDH